MGSVVPTLLALVAVGLFVVALAAMAAGELLIAGLSFLSASVVIYLRETGRHDGDETG
jgi:uncharacterized membrane protein YjjP (DUF1212 family)